MLRILGEENKMDKDWEQFAVHFDKVHSDFLQILKAAYPVLSSHELKLCAYLRMNLSSKEIAQLENISVRGVEISRYRLRKKLKIPTEINLIRLPDGAAFQGERRSGLSGRNPDLMGVLYQVGLDISDAFGNGVEGGTRSSVLFDEPILQAGRFG
jgi:DNA-binding CsgD family transcriptional regulator